MILLKEHSSKSSSNLKRTPMTGAEHTQKSTPLCLKYEVCSTSQFLRGTRCLMVKGKKGGLDIHGTRSLVQLISTPWHRDFSSFEPSFTEKNFELFFFEPVKLAKILDMYTKPPNCCALLIHAMRAFSSLWDYTIGAELSSLAR